MGLISALKSGNHGDSHNHTHAQASDQQRTTGVNDVNASTRDTTRDFEATGATQSNNMNSGMNSGMNTQTEAGMTGGRVVEQCTTQNAPILKEHTRNIREEHIQPVVDREIDQTHVKQTVQHVQDNRAETSHHHGVAGGIARYATEDVRTDDARRYQQNRELHQERSTSESMDAGATINAPVIREKVNKHVVEEIQPVINRDIEHHDVHHTVQPVYEHVTAAPIVGEVEERAPISLQEFESRGGSMSGRGLACERT